MFLLRNGSPPTHALRARHSPTTPKGHGPGRERLGLPCARFPHSPWSTGAIWQASRAVNPPLLALALLANDPRQTQAAFLSCGEMLCIRDGADAKCLSESRD